MRKTILPAFIATVRLHNGERFECVQFGMAMSEKAVQTIERFLWARGTPGKVVSMVRMSEADATAWLAAEEKQV